MRAVQSGQEPQKINTSGDDPALSLAVASARRAIRLRMAGATVDDMIASGMIFTVPVLPPPTSTMDNGEPTVDRSETGVIRYPVPG